MWIAGASAKRDLSIDESHAKMARAKD